MTSGRDPLHMVAGPHTSWTTVNASEAMPGVVTPLTWTFYAPAVESAMRQVFQDLGALRRSEIEIPADPSLRLIGVFFGHAAFNLDQFRAIADRVPGQSGESVEQQFFGAVRPGITSSPVRSRYPAVVAKAPAAVWRVKKALTAIESDARQFWKQSVGTDGLREPDRARALLITAQDFVRRVFRPHGLSSQVSAAIVGRLATMAAQAGHPGLEMRLLSGATALQETMVLTDLWEAGHGRHSLADLLADHGFHGPNEGELAALTWREDPEPLLTLLKTYRHLPDDKSPTALRARRLSDMAEAEGTLFAELPVLRRGSARGLLRLARTYVPLREVGRSAFLQGVDVARAASRVLGSGFSADGILDAPDDIAFLTMDEATAPEPGSKLRELVNGRRRLFADYQSLTLPELWTGQPRPVASEASDPTSGPLTLTGLAVCPGTVEGNARVITDVNIGTTLEEGEILVCPITNPSWASLFLVASAVVIDVGGPLSHGAIVARELGLPCVINTQRGTSVLKTGDRVRVDGGAGTVERIG